jgi:AcrR family transcriptional regulator
MVDLVAEVRSIPRPAPVLSPEREAALTDRQRHLFDQLTELFDDGFAHLTMADLAARMNCSLRTLYQLAPSRDELVTMVIDRNLWRIGRRARQTIEPDAVPLEALRGYLHATSHALSRTTEAFAFDLETLPGARELRARHEDYLVAVAQRLLDVAVKEGHIADVDTEAVARAAASLGALFTRPDLIGRTRSQPGEATTLIVDLLIDGLANPTRQTPEDNP